MDQIGKQVAAVPGPVRLPNGGDLRVLVGSTLSGLGVS
jgi:hypothetical protein